MSDHGTGARSLQRKRKKVNKILNISIGIVICLILLVGGQLLFGGNSSDSSESETQSEANHEPNSTEGSEGQRDEEETAQFAKETEASNDLNSNPAFSNNGEQEQMSLNENLTKQEIPVDQREEETEQANQTLKNGKWKPIGTVQQEPFVAVYQKGHINWEEMKKAFQVATGLDDNMTIWHVGNGGDHQSAVGVVADAATRTTPYKVRLEWVTNEGWMPVSVEQLDENIYISGATSNNE